MTAIEGRMFHLRCGSRKCIRLAVSLAALIVVAATGWAQESDADSRVTGSRLKTETHEPAGDSPDVRLRRLEAVTWNPVTDELTWVVSTGSEATGAYKPVTTETYLVHLESATMKFNGEGRSFSKDEAENVHRLMDLIARYAVESTVWWEAGLGDKVDPSGNSTPNRKERDDQHPQPPQPHPSVLQERLPIADVRGPAPAADSAGASKLSIFRELSAGMGSSAEPNAKP